MTGLIIYEKALHLISETTASDNSLREFTPTYINICLAEAFETENSIRRDEKLPLLLSRPQITRLEDEIPYHESITLVALPYGVASLFFQNDDNYPLFERYRNQFIFALADAQRLTEESIKNVYWGGDDAQSN